MSFQYEYASSGSSDPRTPMARSSTSSMTVYTPVNNHSYHPNHYHGNTNMAVEEWDWDFSDDDLAADLGSNSHVGVVESGNPTENTSNISNDISHLDKSNEDTSYNQAIRSNYDTLATRKPSQGASAMMPVAAVNANMSSNFNERLWNNRAGSWRYDTLVTSNVSQNEDSLSPLTEIIMNIRSNFKGRTSNKEAEDYISRTFGHLEIDRPMCMSPVHEFDPDNINLDKDLSAATPFTLSYRMSPIDTPDTWVNDDASTQANLYQTRLEGNRFTTGGDIFTPDPARNTLSNGTYMTPSPYTIILPSSYTAPRFIQRPEPEVNLNPRRNGGDVFGQDDAGEILTCFVFVRGHHKTLFMNHGPYAHVTHLGSFVAIYARDCGTESNVYMYFKDVRDSVNAMRYIRNKAHYHRRREPSPIEVMCISAEQFVFNSTHLDKPFTMGNLPTTFQRGFDGQVLVKASFAGDTKSMGDGAPEDWMRGLVTLRAVEFMRSFGDIKVIVPVGNHKRHHTTLVFLVEMYQHRTADRLASHTVIFPQGWHHGGVRLWAIHYEPQANFAPFYPGGDDGDEDRRWPDNNFGGTPTRRNAHGSIGQERMNNHPRRPSTRESKNCVNLDRIRCGRDVRTTIMLRNIPNKVDQRMLKELLDQTSFGKYDFMYLRIDFANNCNVGYAFINYYLPEDIVAFVDAVRGQRWANSDKVAEVSYATMQGRDVLVQKFRNSSVMEEHPSARPKLYYPLGHRLAGHEEPFPEPDNLLKLARSNQNAATIGLFSPTRGSAHAGIEHRHRRGQYDRGTSFAEMEEVAADKRLLFSYSYMRRQQQNESRRYFY